MTKRVRKSENSVLQGLVVEPLIIDPAMALSPQKLKELQREMTARYQSP